MLELFRKFKNYFLTNLNAIFDFSENDELWILFKNILKNL